MLFLVWSMFFTPNRTTLRLNMLFRLEHVLHAEPLHTSAKHALAELLHIEVGGTEILRWSHRDENPLGL